FLSGSSSSKSAPNVVIVCKNGTSAHAENVLVNSTSALPNYHVVNVTIIGNESGVQIAAFTTSSPVFNISASNVQIANFSFVSPVTGFAGFILAGNSSLWPTENITIENNTFSNGQGIRVTANNTVIRFNNFPNSTVGVVIGGAGSTAAAKNVVIYSNNFTGNLSMFAQSAQNSIGINIGQAVNRVNITNNTIRNYTFGIYLTPDSNTAALNDFISGINNPHGQVGSAGPNEIYNNTYGIWINQTHGVIVRANNIFNNTYNVVLEAANNTNITENNITSGIEGIYVSGAFNNITYNNITNASGAGITVVNFPSLGTSAANTRINITIFGGTIRQLAGATPRGISIGLTASGSPFGTGVVTNGVDITQLQIIGGNSGGALGSTGVDLVTVGDIRLNTTNISGFPAGVYSSVSVDSGSGASNSIYLVGDRLFNNSYGIYFATTTAAHTLTDFDLNSSDLYNNSEDGLFVSRYTVPSDGIFVHNSKFYENQNGIRLNYTSNAKIIGNLIENNSFLSTGQGVYLYLTNSSNITNNSFYNSKTFSFAEEYGRDNIIQFNNFTNGSTSVVPVYLSVTDNITVNGGFINVNSSGATAVQLQDTTNTTFSNIHIAGINPADKGNRGIRFIYGSTGAQSNFTLNTVNLTHFTDAILVDSMISMGNLYILSSNIFNNTNGLTIRNASNLDINSSNLYNNTNYHINLTNSRIVTLFQNNMNFSNVGVSLSNVTTANLTGGYIQANTSGDIGVYLKDVTIINISKVLISGTSPNTISSRGILLNSGSTSNISNVTVAYTNITNFQNGLDFTSAMRLVSNFYVVNSRVFNNSNYGVFVSNASYVDINGSSIYNNSNYNVNLTNSQLVTMYGNTLNASGNFSLTLGNVSNSNFIENALTNNTASPLTAGQITVLPGGTSSTNLNFTRNNISSQSPINPIGFYFDTGSTASNIRVTGGVINNASRGIYFTTSTGYVTVDGTVIGNSTGSAVAINSTGSFNITNNQFWSCNTGGSFQGCLFVNASTVNISFNNFTNVTRTGIYLHRTTLTAFTNNNITNATAHAVLLNGSSLTFAGPNSIHLNDSAPEVEFYLENSNMSTFSAGQSWNLTTTYMIFAFNTTTNVSMKVVNLTRSTNVTLLTVNSQTPTNGSVLQTLNDNAGNRRFQYGLNVTNTSQNAILRVILYYNSTNYTNIENGGPGILFGTTAPNWGKIPTSVADTNLNYMFSGNSMNVPFGYIGPGVFFIPSPSEPAPSAPDKQKIQPDISYTLKCPENILKVADLMILKLQVLRTLLTL
ncbi:right-handed parallel beta-helix repeat-containing protein, partial [Candidatus Micrarchaeota archaeon]|nr:right-handed parallel beta-helix repeat-containing protein [Candidatus Micrarchaeota archaeon]